MTSKLKVGVLVSGSGSNLQALIDSCAAPDHPAEIVTVISNRPGVKALERARNAGIEAVTIDHKTFADRTGFDAEMQRALDAAGVEFVCLAGFMRLLTTEFVEHWSGRMINIHPSLLPAFKGLNVQQRAIDAGARFSGCTVHFVTPEMDVGPIIQQAAVPILQGDSAESLAARILEQEHRIYPGSLRWIAEGRVKIEGERVLLDGATAPSASLLNPAPDAER
ncbi:phosphoribosylglycinamide formyltransferase [Nisaea acidiphila]|uniref:Phosphoribosylglycinamide formyltransferase n=1 Tax=Nisaea acidiphila TaxID=1862145 RepID=A0A9J7AUE1_9PROT|nr:phosphoribosylglycinamide formyltransferase [Nisaea acidiphila]UUX50943.1 phosphoribosylglycinamide formyltransferase [Nisaea acidiphila]